MIRLSIQDEKHVVRRGKGKHVYIVSMDLSSLCLKQKHHFFNGCDVRSHFQLTNGFPVASVCLIRSCVSFVLINFIKAFNSKEKR